MTALVVGLSVVTLGASCTSEPSSSGTTSPSPFPSVSAQTQPESSPPAAPSAADSPPLAAPPVDELLPDYRPESIEATVLAAGDLALCGSQKSAAVGRLLEVSQGIFIAPGDQAYPDGSDYDFNVCYDTYFGHAIDRTLPVPGNHEYYTEDAEGYYAYFGRPRYYTERIAGWRFYFLDSNCDVVEGCEPGTDQYDWLEAQLQDNADRCVGVVWHHPRWSSNEHGDNEMVAPLYDLAERYGADMLLSGHDHAYERFRRLGANGRGARDGIRQFVVGTGGAGFYDFGKARAGSQARVQAHGLLALDLQDGGYRWRFIDIDGRTLDTGTDSC